MVSASEIYRASPEDLALRPFGDEAAVFSRASGATHYLPPLAACVLGLLLERPFTPGELAAAILSRYDEDGDTIAPLLSEALEELLRLGLIHRQP